MVITLLGIEMETKRKSRFLIKRHALPNPSEGSSTRSLPSKLTQRTPGGLRWGWGAALKNWVDFNSSVGSGPTFFSGHSVDGRILHHFETTLKAFLKCHRTSSIQRGHELWRKSAPPLVRLIPNGRLFMAFTGGSCRTFDAAEMAILRWDKKSDEVRFLRLRLVLCTVAACMRNTKHQIKIPSFPKSHDLVAVDPLQKVNNVLGV